MDARSKLWSSSNHIIESSISTADSSGCSISKVLKEERLENEEVHSVGTLRLAS